MLTRSCVPVYWLSGSDFSITALILYQRLAIVRWDGRDQDSWQP
jgi:hypothetical protein